MMMQTHDCTIQYEHGKLINIESSPLDSFFVFIFRLLRNLIVVLFHDGLAINSEHVFAHKNINKLQETKQILRSTFLINLST